MKNISSLKNIPNTLKLFFFLLIVFVLNVFQANAQAPAIQWQNTIGGSDNDFINSVVQSADGNYYVGGESNSQASGDKSENNILLSTTSDYWIIKLSPAGDIIWQNTIGGDYYDRLTAICPTPDGGCMLGGSSASFASGDKTESCKLNGGGGRTYDYWLVKLSADGEIEWQDVIGGKGDDFLSDMHATTDGGYIIAGNSNSGNSGDKTEVNVGLEGYWIVKLNADLTIEWQNTIDGIYHDYAKSIYETSDGGYIVGGESNSSLSGEKLEPSFNDSYDYWIIKLSPEGDIEWQNTIGGNSDDYLGSVSETSDGQYIVAGYSNSNASGDKTENKKGDEDFWILKLDEDGNIVWQNTIGGNEGEFNAQIQETEDGGFLLCGSSATNLSADKTVTGFGLYDIWLLKLDDVGNILWQDVYGGSNDDGFNSFTQTNDGGILLGSNSRSNISGNKTEDAINSGGGGPQDLWIIKLEGDTCLPTTEVCNGRDDDCDGFIDEDALVTSAIIATDETTFCQGGSVPLSVTYKGNCSFQWKRNGKNISGANSPVYLATKSGVYACKVITNCGPAISEGIVVEGKKNPHATVSASGPLVFCPGGSVVLSANAGGGLIYQWLKNGVDITGATDIDYTATTAGVYRCLVTKAPTGCSKLSNTATVTVACREGEAESIIQNPLFSIYPNPSTNKITVEIQSLNDSELLIIMDITGKQLEEITITQAVTTIDISNFSSGIYLIKLANSNMQYIEKFVKL